MIRYGIPYKGSKNKIASELLAQLPMGKRLIDLFGGGFAISHCALTEYRWKWETVVYNDINPLLASLIKDAIAGKYNYDQFDPVWISREDFHRLREQDGYVKWIWSFGNDGCTYLFGKDNEEGKRQIHEYVVHGIKPSFDVPELTATGIKERRVEWLKAVKAIGKRSDLEQLERLERLQQLEQLERLERLQQLERLEQLEQLQQLELTCMDYRDYEYQDGDVVYCDIPYEDDARQKDQYGIIGGFDQKAFQEWVNTRPYPVYYSGYGKQVVWQKKVQSTMCATHTAPRIETLFKGGGKG